MWLVRPGGDGAALARLLQAAAGAPGASSLRRLLDAGASETGPTSSWRERLEPLARARRVDRTRGGEEAAIEPRGAAGDGWREERESAVPRVAVAAGGREKRKKTTVALVPY
jgi:hypothetical protein